MEKMNFFLTMAAAAGGSLKDGMRCVRRFRMVVSVRMFSFCLSCSRNNSEEFNTSSNALVRSSAPIPTSHGYVLLEAPSSDSETLCRETPRMG